MTKIRKKGLLEGRIKTPCTSEPSPIQETSHHFHVDLDDGETESYWRCHKAMTRFREAVEFDRYQEGLEHYLEAVSEPSLRHLFELFPTEKYEPLEILGAGGFGVAFLCREITGGKSVVKALLSEDDSAQETMIEEAAALQQCRSRQVISITEYGYANWREKLGGPFIATEYREGEDLEKYLQKNGPLSIERGIAVAHALANGLKQAHAAGVVHRDLKPENVLYRDRGDHFELYILDFGLARQYDLNSLTRSLRNGTLPYAAPEQLGQVPDSVGPHTDVYSFGMTLLRMFTGNFNVIDLMDLEHRSLRQIISRCISYQPEKRPADFGEVLELLPPCPEVPIVATGHRWWNWTAHKLSQLPWEEGRDQLKRGYHRACHQSRRFRDWWHRDGADETAPSSKPDNREIGETSALSPKPVEQTSSPPPRNSIGEIGPFTAILALVWSVFRLARRLVTGAFQIVRGTLWLVTKVTGLQYLWSLVRPRDLHKKEREVRERLTEVLGEVDPDGQAPLTRDLQQLMALRHEPAVSEEDLSQSMNKVRRKMTLLRKKSSQALAKVKDTASRISETTASAIVHFDTDDEDDSSRRLWR